ncbi:endonuclease domain-containing protein [Candidatus Parcubacteria bacterium]|nr:endonuclease domain-containing protein [Candidatus Parcubacteria bacterium]
MIERYETFIFEKYHFDADQKVLELHYSFDERVYFTEKFEFGFDFVPYNPEALNKALFGLFVMAGVSYYKAALPPKIVLKQGSLSAQQARFFSQTYRLGLGEFFYRNQLDPNIPIEFPVAGADTAEPVEVRGLEGNLVPIGGGKDSIVTAELLREAGVDFATWNVGDDELLRPLVKRLGQPHYQVKRTVDRELVRLNAAGALNGHVPVSAILAFLAVGCAILTGRQNVVASEEWSAGEGNLVYRGAPINHQYSKSLAFEQNFQSYLKEFISPSIQYFSLLRPLSELKIAEVFCRRYLDRYKGVFSSCNRNFRFTQRQPFGWCGRCPKCAFVYLIFAPFAPKEALVRLFGCKLFESADLDQTYAELLGLRGHKPFECVGETLECRQAVVMAAATGRYPELGRYRFEPPGFDYNQRHAAAMPAAFQAVIDRL